MTDALRQALSDPGSHTVDSLAERLPAFPREAVAASLEALADQGVLERTERPDGTPEYRYVAPDRYAQINLDVVKDPGPKFNQRPR
jgi:predicted transcriptional regulator